MGLRERLQSVKQFFQSAATKGHQLRQDEERDESPAPSGGEQTPQRDERRPGGMTAEGQASQQRDRDRQANSDAAKTAADE